MTTGELPTGEMTTGELPTGELPTRAIETATDQSKLFTQSNENQCFLKAFYKKHFAHAFSKRSRVF
jgi:hypothetical protein